MLPPSADRLALLYRVSQDFNSSLDLDEVLNRVIDEVIAAVRAERGFLMLRDAAGQLRFRVARGIDRHTIEQPQFQVSRSVIVRVAEEGRVAADQQRAGRRVAQDASQRGRAGLALDLVRAAADQGIAAGCHLRR